MNNNLMKRLLARQITIHNMPENKSRDFIDGWNSALYSLMFVHDEYGHWVRQEQEIDHGTAYWYMCSECGYIPNKQFTEECKTPFCPHCGAKMNENV